MSQVVDLEVFYPHSPQRVWQVLTDRRALAAWMMENNFEPKLGHRFQFYSQPLPGLKTTINCEVVELEEPTRLVYTWQESPTVEPSLVIWTLTTVAGGTQLRLKHHQYSYTTAVAASIHPGTVAQSLASGLLHTQPFSGSWGLETSSCYSDPLGKTQSSRAGTASTLASSWHQTFDWDYCLNQRLPNILNQSELISSEC